MTTKSLGVSPSTALPSRPRTLTFQTRSVVSVRNVGGWVCAAGCCGRAGACCAATAAAERTTRTTGVKARVSVMADSEAEADPGVDTPHGPGAGRQTELRAADERLDAGVDDAIQQVRGVETHVHVDARVEWETTLHAAIERERPRSAPRVPSSIAEQAGHRCRVGGGIEIVVARQVARGHSGQRRADW